MVRVVGIDPGTKSFDFCGLDDGKVFLEKTIPSTEIADNPHVVIDILKSAGDLDLIIGPSGYGLPLTHISKIGDKEHFQLILVKPGDLKIGVLVGLRKLVKMMAAEGMNVYFIPGVIHLNTVPEHRKVNKIDLGTADKLCCATLGIYDQSKRLKIGYDQTSFIMVEIGFGYNAVMGVEHGKIVDGIGGTVAGPAFLSQGKMDGELAYLLDSFSKGLLFEGGASTIAGDPAVTPEKLGKQHNDSEQYKVAWNALIEGVERDFAAMNVVVREPREILISGRLSRVPEIYKEVTKRLSKYGEIREVQGFAKNVKEAAQGAALIADGLAGGQYKKLVDTMELRKASGTVLDHIYLSTLDEMKRKYGMK
ncbi:MAG: DUF1464 family protein [Thaumarchaeota archaeon]|nr:DUF1464 family protein [Nitrososphaerota archaeon]MCL5318684.1 DUF1464 family protein [Nitrososphaerota archaeon]